MSVNIKSKNKSKRLKLKTQKDRRGYFKKRNRRVYCTELCEGDHSIALHIRHLHRLSKSELTRCLMQVGIAHVDELKDFIHRK